MSRKTAQSGIVHLLLLIILLVGLAVGIYIVGQKTNLFSKASFSPISQNSEPQVELTVEYQNPFDNDAQYINPFNEYKNPFDSIK